MLTPIALAEEDLRQLQRALVVRKCQSGLEWAVRKPVLLLAALLFFSGCSDLRWAKPGGDASEAARDTAGCRAAASQSLQRQYGAPAPSAGQPDPRFGADTSLPGPADRQVLEAQAVDRCMRAKGYALVPVGK